MKNPDTRRHVIYAVLFIGLSLGWAHKLGWLDKVALPTDGSLKKREAVLQDNINKRNELQIEQKKRLAKRAKLEKLSSGYWQSTGKIPSTEIQNRIERIGKRAGLQLQKVGNPNVDDISENIRAVDVQIHTTTNIRDLAEFCRHIENNKPQLVFYHCNIRTNKNMVTVTGKIRAYVLGRNASAFVTGSEEPES
jgi:hypothetical protein